MSSTLIPQLQSQPHTLIHVRNLQTLLPISTDAWGRPSSSQPVLISLSVSLLSPFSSAASTDKVVEGSTVHYGILSKAILAFCNTTRETEIARKSSDGGKGVLTLKVFAEKAVEDLFSVPTGSKEGTKAILRWSFVSSVSITVTLPKASLLGNGVKLSQTFTRPDSQSNGIDAGLLQLRYMVLQVCDLKIPCVIGVNPHERESKQIVVANVGLEFGNGADSWAIGDTEAEQFWQFERAITSAIEASSFQTLEAMTTKLTSVVIQNYLSPLLRLLDTEQTHSLKSRPYLRILLEKPTAVTLADAPGVEVFVDLGAEGLKELWK